MIQVTQQVHAGAARHLGDAVLVHGPADDGSNHGVGQKVRLAVTARRGTRTDGCLRSHFGRKAAARCCPGLGFADHFVLLPHDEAVQPRVLVLLSSGARGLVSCSQVTRFERMLQQMCGEALLGSGAAAAEAAGMDGLVLNNL